MVDSHPIDVTTTRSTAGAQGSIHTIAEHQAQTDEITIKIYGLQMLHLRLGEVHPQMKIFVLLSCMTPLDIMLGHC